MRTTYNQGDYTQENPPGFWPEYEEAVFDELRKAYENLKVTRVWAGSSKGVMDSIVVNKTADVTALYWTVSAFYNNRARTESLDMGCTTMGSQQWFFTKRDVSELVAAEEGETTYPLENG